MDLAAFAPIANLGAAGVLLAVAVWLLRVISRGDWVSRRETDYMRADFAARIAEKNTEIAELRAGYETERTAREVAIDHARELASGLSTVERTLEALRVRAESSRDEA